MIKGDNCLDMTEPKTINGEFPRDDHKRTRDISMASVVFRINLLD